MVIIAFLVMIPCAWLTLLGWPKVQMGIESLQAFLRSAGALGVWVYTFLERILIPTGLHHFVYGPFIFGPAAVEGGIQVYWAQHLQEFSQSTESLKTLFPERWVCPARQLENLWFIGHCSGALLHRTPRKTG